MMLTIFSCTLWPSLCLLWRNVHLGVWKFLLDCLVFYIELYELFVCMEINSLWVSSFDRIFPFLVVFVFHWWFPVLFKCFEGLLGPICLVSFVLSAGSKKNLLHFMSKCVLLFFLRSSIVPVLFFRPLIYLQFIFVYGVRESSSFILLFMLRNLPRVLHSGCSQFPSPASLWEGSLFLYTLSSIYCL